MARIWVGLSGWSYPQWRGTFYPQDLPSRRYRDFYAQEFLTTEINSSFYRFVQPQTYQKWAQLVPQDFVFAVKANRLFTHTQRLQDVNTVHGHALGNARMLLALLRSTNVAGRKGSDG